MTRPVPLDATTLKLRERYRHHPGPWVMEEDALHQMFPGIGPIREADPGHAPHQRGDLDDVAFGTLHRIVDWARPQVSLELGTFRGRTTRMLAATSGGLVVTVDLPIEMRTGRESHFGTDADYFQALEKIGDRIRGVPESGSIRQVFADCSSAASIGTIRRALEGRSVDLAFIDAAHDFDSVRIGFEQLVLPVLAPDAVVVFDDYNRLVTHPGVSEYLMTASRVHNRPLYWYHAATRPTSLVIYLASEPTREWRR